MKGFNPWKQMEDRARRLSEKHHGLRPAVKQAKAAKAAGLVSPTGVPVLTTASAREQAARDFGYDIKELERAAGVFTA